MRRITFLLLITLGIISTIKTQAQTVADYVFTQTLGTYTPITGGTSILAPGNDDTESPLTNIGFAFDYHGVSFTQFSASPNGYICLGAVPTSISVPLSNTPNCIAFASRDAMINTDVTYLLSGTAPNRVFTIQYPNLYLYYGGTSEQLTAQIKLYETTNVIEIVYGSSAHTTAYVPQTGLSGAAVTDFSVRTTTTNWSASTAATSNTATMTWSATVFPANGLTYTWTPSSCNSPTALGATGITQTTANLSWTSLGTLFNIQYGPTGFALGTGTIVNGVPASPYALSGLTASTGYSFYVQNDCGGGSTSNWAGPFNFTTLCAPMTAPYSQNFDGVTTPNLPACWSKQVVFTAGTPNVQTTSTAPYSVPNCAQLYNSTASGSGTHLLLITPQFTDLPSQTTQIRFWAKFTGSGTALLNVGTMTDPAVPTSFSVFQSIMTLTSTWQEFVIPFSTYVGTNQFIAFKHGLGLTNQYIYIDNVVYETIPTCPQPSVLSASGILDVSANLNWTSNGTETLWNIQYGPAGFTLGTGTMVNGVTAHPYTLTGLTGSTNYSYYVQADCGGGDVSSWSGPYSFTTACAIFTAPFAEHFNTTTIPLCWSMSGPQAWLFTNTWPAYGAAALVGTDHSGTGGSFAGVDGSGSVSLTGITLLTPLINTSSLTSPQLRFFLFNNNTNDLINYQTLNVDVYDGSTWHNSMFTWGPTQNNAAWQEIVVLLNSLTITGPIQVRFVVAKSAGSPFYDDLVIDDVYIEESPTCIKPSALTATNITDLSADLGWTTNSGETMWDIQYGPTGFALGTGTIINNVTSNPYTLTGLSSFTNYQYYVLAQCSPTDSSIWNGPFSFSTLITQCSGVPVPGVITSSVNPVCPGINFNLYLGGYNGGTTFQWQSSTDGVTFSNIAGGTNDTISVNQPAIAYYQCIVTCTASGLSDTTAVYAENVNTFINCYCTSNATSTADEEIFNVTLGTLNNSSTCSTTGGPGSILSQYSNYTALPAPNLSRTLSINFSVQIGTCGGNYGNGIAIWIDYNQNGLFTDPGEKVYNSATSVSGPHIETGSFVIPLTATLGNTRMRIVNVETGTPSGITPCGTYTWGETEDYLVNIAPAPTCLSPTALGVTNLLDVSADLTWTNGSTETIWDIQYGPTGFALGTGTIVNNVTTNPYHITGLTPTTTYQFYVLAQCSPTDSSFWAGPFSFTTQLPICSGTPTAGTVTSSVSPVCPGVNFNLIVSGYTIGGGINFQWQSSLDGITYTNIGANNDTISVNQADTTYYQCIVTCIGSGLSDTTAVFIENSNPFINCYCTSNATNTADEEIFNVTVGSLNNTSDCSTVAGPGSILNEYSNFMALTPPDLSRTTAVNLSVHVNTCGTTNYNSGLAIFIDYNQNGLFTDPGERVYSNGAAADITCVPATIVTGSFTVPLTATLGNTRMRVVDAEGINGNTIDPCGTYGYGETEDYTVNIIGAPSCMQPTALGASNILDVSADLSWTANASETAWDIQYGPTGFTLGTGTILNNVTTNPYNLTGLSSFTTYQYYVLAQCSPTDSSFWSGPYSFTTLLSLCSAIPNPGTVVSSMNPVCPSVNFNLTLSGSSVASGLTYQWQSSTDGITFADIAGATNDTLTTQITDTMFYQCIVTCTYSTLSDTTPVFQENLGSFYGCYCASNATSTADEDIFNVTLATLNNSSTCSTTGGPGSIMNQYSNYTALPAPMLGQSTTVSFSVQIGTCGGNYGNGIAIFIDFNQNGLYTDAGEKVFFSATSTSGPHIESGSISIPLTANLGLTGMRVVNVETGTPSGITPCGTYTWGETEDYIVNIVPAPTCIQPSTLTATNITANTADLGWTAVNGETSWDIQYGPTGFVLGTGTIQQNVTTNPYTLTGLAAATTYQYYVLGQCSPTDSSFWSGPFTFTTLCGIILPDYYQPFTSYVPNCWSEAAGQLGAPTTFTSTTTSNWIQDGFANVGTTGAARLEVWSTGLYAWLISPEIDLGSSGTDYQAEFDLALTAWGSTGNPGTTGTDDKFVVVISTDGGLTWSSANALRTWDNAGSPFVYNSIPATGTHVIIPLTGYTGVVKFGFYGESTVSNADNDIFVDNFRVRKPIDLALVSPTSGTHNYCGLSATESLTIWVKNVGITTIATGALITTGYKVNFTPAVNESFNLTADLLPNDSVSYTFTQTADFSAVTSYLVNYWIHYSEDISATNDTAHTTLVNYTIYVNIAGGDTVLVDPIFMPYTLTVQASPFTYDTYAWSNASGSATATTSTFDTPDFGWYYLTVTDGACTANDSIFVDNLTNVNSVSASNSISVYPNPTDGRFSITVHAGQKSDYMIEMYSSDGKKVYQKKIKNTSDISEHIDGSKLAEGLYSVKIAYNGKVEVFKVSIY